MELHILNVLQLNNLTYHGALLRLIVIKITLMVNGEIAIYHLAKKVIIHKVCTKTYNDHFKRVKVVKNDIFDNSL